MIRIPFVKSARNKFQVRETVVVVNLQAKVAPSHIGANHLVCSKKRRDGGVQVTPLNFESKKIKTIQKTDHL